MTQRHGSVLPFLIFSLSLMALLFSAWLTQQEQVNQSMATQHAVDATSLSTARMESRMIETLGILNRVQLLFNQAWVALEAAKQGSVVVSVITLGAFSIWAGRIHQVAKRLQPALLRSSRLIARGSRRWISSWPSLVSLEAARIGKLNQLQTVLAITASPLWFRMNPQQHAQDLVFDFTGDIGQTWVRPYLESNQQQVPASTQRMARMPPADKLPSPLYLDAQSAQHALTLFGSAQRYQNLAQQSLDQLSLPKGALASAQPFCTQIDLSKPQDSEHNLYVTPWQAQLVPVQFPDKARSPFAWFFKSLKKLNDVESKIAPWLKGPQH